MKCICNKLSYSIFLFVLLLNASCEKQPTDYRSFLNDQEVIYPAAASDVDAGPGNHRVLLEWKRSSDPNIRGYVIYWNQRTDSVVVKMGDGQETGTVKTYINSLNEGVHSFQIYSFDDKGNRSIPVVIENVEVYGEKYQGNLLNRGVSGVGYADNKLTITWDEPDTINVHTEIKYTDLSGSDKTVLLPVDSSMLVIPDWKLPTKIYYRSAYIPEKNAIDTFEVTYYDSLTIAELPVDKSSWTQAFLAGDAVVNAFGTSLNNMWDGEPGGYPDVYHSDGAGIPHTFSIDLGQTYDHLTKFEEWGRTDLADHNPVEFEVWGIADTTGAIPTPSSADPSWKNESIAKGWTLLTEVKRSDDGIEGVQYNLIENPPPVRFIRIRVLHTSGGTTYSHMSEISFWYKP